MDESRKRHEFVPPEASTEKRPRVAVKEAEDVDDDILAWISVEEETVGELMMLLDDVEKSRPMEEKVKFIDDPYSSAVIFQSSSSYVTINGNEESCGSSFSESDSSMMASVDMNGARIKLMEIDSETVEKWKLWSEDRLKEEEETSAVLDGFCWDEDDLARFIGDEEQIF
ncbi:uncharacterized protein LOC120080324 [Benincasa hispida]|uniref:uncharacterized protein LOC120080324 n=1 Tax=Benincasa hispida TaxID=102211 RepID=UPI0018FFB77E|nr:uncharacterized protein LOC120080324 [Benincasa hispida]